MEKPAILGKAKTDNIIKIFRKHDVSTETYTYRGKN